MRYSNSALKLALHFIVSKSAVTGFQLAPSSYHVLSNTRLFSTDSQPTEKETTGNYDTAKSPWAPENNMEPIKKGINKSRFRQHVNPLARKFQMETELDAEWPNDGTFSDPTLPLHIDVGCGKGGFLLELAKQRLESPNESEGERNYLGLEIRPSVATFAKQRVAKRGLTGKMDFIGCNANVDLDRILTKYTKYGGEIALVSVSGSFQFSFLSHL